MPIASFVLTLSSEPVVRGETLATLASLEGLELGEMQPRNRLPVVTDCPSLQAQQQLWAAIESTPGVSGMDLVFFDFSDVEQVESNSLPQRHYRVFSAGEGPHGSS